MQSELRDMREALSGDSTLGRREKPTPPSLLTAVSVASSPAVSARGWRAIVSPYERRSDARALFQLVTTVALLAAAFVAMERATRISPWLIAPLAIPAGLLLVRMFIIMHDCGHGSFLSSRKLNDAVGWLAGVITFTPYAQWRRDHALHHASSGDLDRRGHGDVKTLTVSEFQALSRGAQWRYRLMRNPIVLLVFGPLHLIFTQRIRPPGTAAFRPADAERLVDESRHCRSARAVRLFRRLRAVALTYFPALYLAASAGIWLFYVQHQFDATYWSEHPSGTTSPRRCRGSSYLRFRGPLRWFTGDIGVHHVHHLSPRIPNYQLRRCHDENTLFHDVTTLRIGDTWRLFRLALWDDTRQCLVSFGDAER